jgi:hypothetical protein
MASPTAAVEPLLASSMRVLRNITPLQDFIAAWPIIKQKSLTSPPTLTESERRLLLDLPPEELEKSYLRAATILSREQLIEKAISSQELLTLEEIDILQHRFWTERTTEENQIFLNSIMKSSPEGQLEFLGGFDGPLAYEWPAIQNGGMESAKRQLAADKQSQRAAANLVLPDAKEWIQHLYHQDKTHWGFICLYDAAVQQFSPQRLDDFECTKDGFFRHALMYNGSKDIINTKWAWFHYNAPNTVLAPATKPVEDNNYPDGAVLGKAFQEILKDPQEYQKRPDVTPTITYTGHLKDGIAKAGFLTNTFLLIDPTCVESILENGAQPASVLWDNMRVLAFEADFPVPGRQYEEGYQGFTWVRLDQLIYNFYELRLMKAEEVGMDKIWKAAQQSRHQAFVSMDPEEASSYTDSCGLWGFTRDSVIGKRWYAMRDPKEAASRMGDLAV